MQQQLLQGRMLQRIRKLLFVKINLSFTFYNEYLSVIIAFLFLLGFHPLFLLKETFRNKLFSDYYNKKQSVQRSCRKTLICNTVCNALFEKVSDIKGFKLYNETNKSHRQERSIFSLVCFKNSHKGFQRIHSSTNKGKQNELSAIHFCLFSLKDLF